MDVNHLHHDPSAAQRKRTSIHQLLNPIGPSTSLDQQYAQQLPSLSQFVPQAHPAHVPAMPPPQYSSPINSQPSFSLRTASWDQSATKVQDDFSGRPESDPNACRYDPPAMPPQHQYYQDPYPRSSRSANEPPNYAMDAPSWATAPEPVNASYSMYSNDRTGALQRQYLALRSLNVLLSTSDPQCFSISQSATESALQCDHVFPFAEFRVRPATSPPPSPPSLRTRYSIASSVYAPGR